MATSSFALNDNSMFSKNFLGKEDPFKIFDFLFPGSNQAKLVKVFDAYAKNFPYHEILKRLGLSEGVPVVNLIGAKSTQDRTNVYAGISRACYSTDAVIIDSGLSSGIEKHATRRSVKLIGVAPENEVQYPKINAQNKDPLELSAGHTDLFLINNLEDDLQWTQEALFRATLALRIAEGNYAQSGVYQRVVNILVGDTPYYIDDIRYAIKFQQPILIVQGSKICSQITEAFSRGDSTFKGISEELAELISQNSQYFFILIDASSDEVAQYVHFFLTVTPYQQQTPLLYQRKQQQQQQQRQQNDDSSLIDGFSQVLPKNLNLDKDEFMEQQEEDEEQEELKRQFEQSQQEKEQKQSQQQQQQSSPPKNQTKLPA